MRLIGTHIFPKPSSVIPLRAVVGMYLWLRNSRDTIPINPHILCCYSSGQVMRPSSHTVPHHTFPHETLYQLNIITSSTNYESIKLFRCASIVFAARIASQRQSYPFKDMGSLYQIPNSFEKAYQRLSKFTKPPYYHPIYPRDRNDIRTQHINRTRASLKGMQVQISTVVLRIPHQVIWPWLVAKVDAITTIDQIVSTSFSIPRSAKCI
jgi:hypothetical protein